MDAHTLIDLLGARAGTPMVLSPTGTLALNFENGMSLDLRHDASLGVLLLSVVVGEVPVDGEVRLALYGVLLESNLMGEAITGGTLALDQDTEELKLTRCIDLGMTNVEHLANAIEAMAESAEQWGQFLEDMPEEADSLWPNHAQAGKGLESVHG